jgi:hypothetical protein
MRDIRSILSPDILIQIVLVVAAVHDLGALARPQMSGALPIQSVQQLEHAAELVAQICRIGVRLVCLKLFRVKTWHGLLIALPTHKPPDATADADGSFQASLNFGLLDFKAGFLTSHLAQPLYVAPISLVGIEHDAVVLTVFQGEDASFERQ